LLITCSVFVAVSTVIFTLPRTAQTPLFTSAVCPQIPAGSIVYNPPEIRNPSASNPANFTVLNITPERNCYLANGKLQAPTLRVTPGKKDLVLKLTNRLSGQSLPVRQQTQCVGGMPAANAINLHYHGLNVSPSCHQDEVVKTVIQPNETFKFSIEIPQKEPPGLYWYHPHVHMHSAEQVLSGLTGAMIVEGIGKLLAKASSKSIKLSARRSRQA